MESKSKKHIFVCGLLSFVFMNCVSLVSITYAVFDSSRLITQGVGSSGIVGIRLMLNPGTWDVDNPDYVMYSFMDYEDAQGNPQRRTEWVASLGRQSNKGYYVFHFQHYANFKYTEGGQNKINIIFARMNPDRTDKENRFDSGYCWNQTSNLKYIIGSSNYVYRITSWNQSEQTDANWTSYS